MNLATETALVRVRSESVETSGWEKIKRQLADALAKHLTTCGFKSTVRGMLCRFIELVLYILGLRRLRTRFLENPHSILSHCCCFQSRMGRMVAK